MSAGSIMGPARICILHASSVVAPAIKRGGRQGPRMLESGSGRIDADHVQRGTDMIDHSRSPSRHASVALA
jgi:hypothetical protein